MVFDINHANATVQTAFVVYEVGKLGYGLYKRFYSDWFKAKEVVAKVDVEVRDVLNEVENGFDFETDQISEIISAQTMDVIENTTTKRKVRAKAPFRAFLVRAGKAKFGLPNVTEANRMCVRKYLYDICISHGVVARHIAENVDFATEMVFIPTAWEMRTAAITKTNTTKGKERVMRQLRGAETSA
jgi:hypothetical protein